MLPESNGRRGGKAGQGMDGQDQKDERAGLQPDAVPGQHGTPADGRTARYEHHYNEVVDRLVLKARLTALTPLGERTCVAEYCLWDTGATNTVINRPLAERLDIEPMPPMDDELQPMGTVDSNYLGTVTARLRIGDVLTPFDLFKVSDLDPDGKYAAMGYQIPDMLIGMDIIGRGRFCVDSTSGETVVTFEME